MIFDHVPDGHKFGDVIQDVNATYQPGDIVQVVFYGANPRSNLHTQGSFLYIERLDGGNWTLIAVDGDWETKFKWLDAGKLVSQITVEWDIPTAPAPAAGTYRVRYTGDAKSLDGTITPFTGLSSLFAVQSATA